MNFGSREIYLNCEVLDSQSHRMFVLLNFSAFLKIEQFKNECSNFSQKEKIRLTTDRMFGLICGKSATHSEIKHKINIIYFYHIYHRYAEIMVLLNFILLVLLWFFREPKFMPGWGELFKKKYEFFSFLFSQKIILATFSIFSNYLYVLKGMKSLIFCSYFHRYISDGTASVIIGFLLFQIPSQAPEIFSKGKPRSL